MWIDDVLAAARARDVVSDRRTRPLRSLTAAIDAAKSRGLNPVIAELKMASPSGFKADVDPAGYLAAVSGGATALSIVTEPVVFGGTYGLLRAAAASVELPLLMKDFVVSEGQVKSAASLGADAVLLIVRILGDEELVRLYGEATSMGLEVLVEVHDEHDLMRALELKPRMIGVNSRDLMTLSIDMDSQTRILERVPSGMLKVAESGISDADDVRRLREAGADAFLVGTALMRNPGLLYELLNA